MSDKDVYPIDMEIYGTEGSEAMKVQFLGCILGEASGWDGDLDQLIFSDFKSSPELVQFWPASANALTIEIYSGKWVDYDENGKVTAEGNIVHILNFCKEHNLIAQEQ